MLFLGLSSPDDLKRYMLLGVEAHTCSICQNFSHKSKYTLQNHIFLTPSYTLVLSVIRMFSQGRHSFAIKRDVTTFDLETSCFGERVLVHLLGVSCAVIYEHLNTWKIY